MRPRILHVLSQAEWGSAAGQLDVLVRSLGGDYDCHLATGDVGCESVGPGSLPPIEVHRAPPGRWWRKSLDPIWLGRLIRRLQPHLIHLWRWPETWLAGLVARACSNAAIFADLRAVPPLSPEARAICRWGAIQAVDLGILHCPWFPPTAEGRCYPRRRVLVPDVIVVPTTPARNPQANEALKSELASPAWLPGSSSRFSDAERSLESASALWEFDAEAKIVLAAGRLERRKRLRDAIWAADLLKVIRGDLHLCIAGDGPDRDGLTWYRDRVRIEDRVHLLGRVVDMEPWWRSCVAVWCPAESEDVPQFALEAACRGIPVIASDTPFHRRLIGFSQRIEFFPLGDRAGLARRMQDLLLRLDRSGVDSRSPPTPAASMGNTVDPALVDPPTSAATIEVPFLADECRDRYADLYAEWVSTRLPGGKVRGPARSRESVDFRKGDSIG